MPIPLSPRPSPGSPRLLRLGTTVQGAGVTRWGWKHPDVEPDASANFDFYARMARAAETAGFDFVFIADALYVGPTSAPHSLDRLEPMTLLGALAVATQRIGLVGTASTSFADPYTVARQFASLDRISGGRAGWNLVTTGLEGSARNFGRDRHEDHATRYRRAAEHLAVVRGLWDSWEDDAFVADRATGRFFRPDRLHRLDHHGEFFAVAGPLNIARSAQGHPVVFVASGSDDGMDLAAHGADAVFNLPDDLAEAQAFADAMRSRAGGRAAPIVFAGISVTVAETEAEAERKFAERAALIGIDEAIGQLGRLFSYLDLSGHDLDAPFPDLGQAGENSYRSSTDRIKRIAAERRLSLRQTALLFAQRRGAFVGSADQVTDRIVQWFETGAVDGLLLMPTDLPNLHDFTSLVVPRLRARGLLPDADRAGTLRTRLGLRFADNVHTLARRASAAPSGT
jgi:FMN-dependent oxidoreductase (nitrilotriacetate monooxygenase family)